MTWVALLLVLAFAGMAVKNRTPGQALYSVARETLRGLRRLRLPLPSLEKALGKYNPKVVHHSPYKRTRAVRHFPLLLNLPTSDGSGEAAHPDVLHVPEGWGEGKWTHLMAATPYPSGNDFLENPEFYVSRDGLVWNEPARGVNPLSAVPVETARRDLKKEYHSDASLLLHEGTLTLYYRWTGALLDGSFENRIYAMKSKNGIQWSDRILLLEERGPAAQVRKLLSPSVLFANGEFLMWTVESEDGKRRIVRRTSDDGLRWSAPEATPVFADYPLQDPWHLDVLEDDGKWILALTTAQDRGFEADLHLGFGDEGGRSWHMAGKLIEPGYFFEDRRVYRASIAPRKNAWDLYYSALSADGTWNIARVGLTLDAKDKTFKYTEPE